MFQVFVLGFIAINLTNIARFTGVPRKYLPLTAVLVSVIAAMISEPRADYLEALVIGIVGGISAVGTATFHSAARQQEHGQLTEILGLITKEELP